MTDLSTYTNDSSKRSIQAAVDVPFWHVPGQSCSWTSVEISKQYFIIILCIIIISITSTIIFIIVIIISIILLFLILAHQKFFSRECSNMFDMLEDV